MKKALSILLSVLVIFSMLGMVAAAEDATEVKLVTITFVVDGKAVQSFRIKENVSFVDRISAGGDAELGIPTKKSENGVSYEFKYWEMAANVTVDADGVYSYDLTGITVNTGNIPAADKDTVYVAVFGEKEIKETQSFWAFVQSIFERINMIFEYFSKVFEGVFDF